MPAKIGPDGKPIVVPTKPYKADYDETNETTPYDPDAPRRSPQDFDERGVTEPYKPEQVSSGHQDRPTVDVKGATPVVVEEGAEVTRVFRASSAPSTAPSASPGQASSPAEADSAAMQDPPTGWLVVVKVPGQGEFVTIGHGQNTVGRGGARANLNFGDAEISRESHIMVVYDPQGRQFFVSPGTGKALGYLNGSPILSPSPLKNHDTLKVGATELRFIAFCGEEFTWE